MRGDEGYIDEGGTPHLNVLDLQMQIRRLPKPVVAMVAGYAGGRGHVLHLVCDLTIAENARFGQTGPRVGSFDAGLGAGLLARTIGVKRAGRSGSSAGSMTLPRPWTGTGQCRSPGGKCWRRPWLGASGCWTFRPMIKAGFNADTDGLAGIQELAGNATGLFYMTAEGPGGATPGWSVARRIFPLPQAAVIPISARWLSSGLPLPSSLGGWRTPD